MRSTALIVALLFLGGCATTSSVRESHERVFVWPEWEPTPLPLIESLDPHPVRFSLSTAAPRRIVGEEKSTPAGPTFEAPPVAPVPPPAPAAAVAPPPPVQDQVPVEYANAGTSVSFVATADGTPPFTFQWRKDGRPLAGATQATLSLQTVSATDAGVYVCVVTNAVGHQMSPPIRLVVRPP